MKKAALKYVIFVAAALMVMYGMVNGEPETVAQKATKVCLECIGIG
ncbi:MAG: thioredoxin [Firmicutes bacterium]|nr:thioredoxin [Bacillota bacterium]